ncbi:hypothetical protein [Nitrosopumilus sp.]|uniref:hypothetical protein n=1 Tax=Nitrosopumilus sp. TaxID=2024843 RepID=UPI0034A05FC7
MKTSFLIIFALVFVFPVAFGQYMGGSSEMLEERLGTDLLKERECIENPDEKPAKNFVFFDCNWVEVPYGWIFKDGMWQEDPSVQRLGPAPLPTCPRIDICTCDGKDIYYNSTDQQCHSSPYMPSSNQELCEEFSQMKFEGWNFNTKYCDWVPLSDPYETDESMKLASKKVGVGGLGIDPEFDIATILVGMATAMGVALGLLFYWRRK